MEILGVKIDNLTTEEVLQKIEDFLNDKKQHYIVTPNPEFLVQAQKDKEFKEILSQADLAVPDGIGLIFAARFLGQPIKERITGVDLMEMICQLAAQKKWPVFLLGGEEEVAEETADNLRDRYKGIEIKVLKARGYSFWNARSTTRRLRRTRRGGHGVAEGDERGDLASEPASLGLANDSRSYTPSLNQTIPAILFVALGAPKQEKWIVNNLAKMPTMKLAMGVGGAFDFISGRVRRAPQPLRQLGLEWLWRLFCQPWRAKRIFNAVVKFPWLVIKSGQQKAR